MKIERIILFTKGIETLSFFSEQLGKTFSKLGYEVFYFDQCKSYDSLAELLLFAKPEATAAVTFNFDGCCGEGYFIDCKGIHLFDDRKIPVINIVVDHPFYYHKFLPFLPKDYCQISIDREHEAYLQYYFPEITRRFLNLNRRLRDMAKSMPIFITELLRTLRNIHIWGWISEFVSICFPRLRILPKTV